MSSPNLPGESARLVALTSVVVYECPYKVTGSLCQLVSVHVGLPGNLAQWCKHPVGEVCVFRAGL